MWFQKSGKEMYKLQFSSNSKAWFCTSVKYDHKKIHLLKRPRPVVKLKEAVNSEDVVSFPLMN